MIQSTLFSYFTFNNTSIKPATHKLQSLKQTILKDYFAIKPKKKTILDYFKQQEEKVKEQKKGLVYNLVLVDIWNSYHGGVLPCVKKNMYDPDLKYIAVSYRWGEVEEQSVKTPDYIAYVTSFRLMDLGFLCYHIKSEPDLKDIQYLWIDAISVDQYNNYEKKKEIISHVSDIYKKAAYILAVPDLHFGYLKKNPLNNNILDADEKYKQAVYNDIFNNNSYKQPINKNEIATIKMENENRPKKKNVHRILKQFIHSDHQSITDNKTIQIENENKKKIYQFLAYLIEDWSNRAWVISEYLIAKEKQKTQGVPLKYIFMSLFHQELTFFFSYSFDHQHHSPFTTINADKNDKIKPWEVDDGSKFNNFLKTVFAQRSYLSVLLVSNATRNEDKFHAILPIWDRYHHCIKGINTISEWNITDSISVQLKLYEMMDDLWDKARLLYACSKNLSPSLLPSYARRYRDFDLFIIEKDKVDMAYEKYLSCIKEYALDTFGNNNSLQHIMDNNNNNNKKEYASSLYTENLMDIQLNFHNHHHYHQYHYLSIKVKQYFICKEKPKYNYGILSACSLNYDDDLISVYIPFFTFTIPYFTNVLPPIDSTGIFLFGSMDQNRWIVCSQVIIPNPDNPNLIYNFP